METSQPVVRPYRPSDFEQVKALHETMGLDYRFPDLTSHLFVVKKVVEIEGRIIACGVMRISAELYLWIDPQADPLELWHAEWALVSEGLGDAALMGIEDCVAWIPPEVEKRFSKRLKILGFSKDRPWATWSRRTRNDDSTH